MKLNTPIDPRAMRPLAYLTGRLGYEVIAYCTTGPGQDAISTDLRRGDTEVHVDWFPRTSHVFVSQGTQLLSVHRSLTDFADALERLP